MSSGYLSSGIAAAGTVSLTGTAIDPNANFVQISTCAAGAGVRLPAMARGVVIKARNDGAGYGYVYPPTGGTVNGLAVDAGYILSASGGEAEFICGGSLTILAYATNGIAPVIPC